MPISEKYKKKLYIGQIATKVFSHSHIGICYTKKYIFLIINYWNFSLRTEQYPRVLKQKKIHILL